MEIFLKVLEETAMYASSVAPIPVSPLTIPSPYILSLGLIDTYHSIVTLVTCTNPSVLFVE